MADIIDRANDRAEEILADTLRDRERARKPRAGDYCVDCGEEIPANRRQFSKFVIRCLDCQSAHELRIRQGQV